MPSFKSAKLPALSAIPQQHRQITFASVEEARTAVSLEYSLKTWVCEYGKTYQKPIDDKHQADFYLPDRNIVLEIHPIVLKWCLSKQSLSAITTINRQLNADQQQLLENTFKAEKIGDYYQKRRFFMDHSPDPEMRRARLIVCQDWHDVYVNIAKPYSEIQIKENEFRDIFFSIKRG